MVMYTKNGANRLSRALLMLAIGVLLQ